MSMQLRSTHECTFDVVSLGEVMLRLDPDQGRVRTARMFRACEGGGEYNVARGLRRCFGLRGAIVTSLVRDEVGRLLEDLILTSGLDTRFIQWVDSDGVGRAARNASGHVIMYGDVVTGSMRRAIDETERRREIQEAYNKEHGIVPKTIVKPVVPLIEMTLVAAEGTAPYGKKDGKKKKLGKKERENLVKSLLREMQQASRALEFERAAELRDMIVELEGELPKKK